MIIFRRKLDNGLGVIHYFVTSSAVPTKRTDDADHSEEMPRNGIIKCFLGVVFI